MKFLDRDFKVTFYSEACLLIKCQMMILLFVVYLSCAKLGHQVTESYYETQVVSDAGHSANEPGISAELVAANEKLKNIIKNKGD
jgi:hypothetical protein